jgi:hypothetical protein
MAASSRASSNCCWLQPPLSSTPRTCSGLPVSTATDRSPAKEKVGMQQIPQPTVVQQHNCFAITRGC